MKREFIFLWTCAVVTFISAVKHIDNSGDYSDGDNLDDNESKVNDRDGSNGNDTINMILKTFKEIGLT